jgi:SulP family sulfate permease
MSLYRDGIASATVEADTDLVVLRLSAETVERLERDDPALALRLHRLLGRVLVERVSHADELIEAVLRSRT